MFHALFLDNQQFFQHEENFANIHDEEDIAASENESSPKELDVDKTVEEFSKVVEEEEKVLHDQTPIVKKSRKGRLIGIYLVLHIFTLVTNPYLP